MTYYKPLFERMVFLLNLLTFRNWNFYNYSKKYDIC